MWAYICLLSASIFLHSEHFLLLCPDVLQYWRFWLPMQSSFNICTWDSTLFSAPHATDSLSWLSLTVHVTRAASKDSVVHIYVLKIRPKCRDYPNQSFMSRRHFKWTIVPQLFIDDEHFTFATNAMSCYTNALRVKWYALTRNSLYATTRGRSTRGIPLCSLKIARNPAALSLFPKWTRKLPRFFSAAEVFCWAARLIIGSLP